MSDTRARGLCSNDLAWEIQDWTTGKVTLEFVLPGDRNTQVELVTFTPEQARALAKALNEAAEDVPVAHGRCTTCEGSAVWRDAPSGRYWTCVSCRPPDAT
jgi:hypothetical protein